MQDVFRGGGGLLLLQSWKGSRGKKKTSACVCVRKNVHQQLHISRETQNDESCKKFDKLFDFYIHTHIGAVGLLHRAVSASSRFPSTAHSLAQLTQEILKTVCYFCLIIHLNPTSYTSPTRSAAYSSNVSFFPLHFCCCGVYLE